MRWYVWLLLSPIILAVLAGIVLVIAYEFSDEAALNREARRRYKQESNETMKRIDERIEKRREEIKQEILNERKSPEWRKVWGKDDN